MCLKTKLTHISGGGLHIDEHCWTLDKPTASLSTCHLSLWLGWQILLNLVNVMFLKIKFTQVHYSRALPKLACAGSSEFGLGVIVQAVMRTTRRLLPSG